jgi:hypothetical protein
VKPKHVVNRILAMTRMMKLGRQLREVESAIYALPGPLARQVATITMRELELAQRCDPPWMYGTPPDETANEWGTGADIGIDRVRSDNPQVRMRGIGLWLAVIYHESGASHAHGAQELHRHVMRVVRQLKERIEVSAPSSDTSVDVGNSSPSSAAVA